MLPPPIGQPELAFRLWSFGNMRPLASTPHNITVTNTYTSYLDVFIPANTLANNKRIVVYAAWDLNTHVPNQVGGPLYTDAYGLNGAVVTARQAANNVGVAPQFTRAVIDRKYYYQGGVIFEQNFTDANNINSPAYADGAGHDLNIQPVIGLINPTVDNILNFMIITSFGASTDSLVVAWSQAFIQSPVDLRRLIS